MTKKYKIFCVNCLGSSYVKAVSCQESPHLSLIFLENKYEASPTKNLWFFVGEVAEWLKATVLKTVMDFGPSRVRISTSPFFFAQTFSRLSYEATFFLGRAKKNVAAKLHQKFSLLRSVAERLTMYVHSLHFKKRSISTAPLHWADN